MKNRKWVWGVALMVMAIISACAQKYDPEEDFSTEPVDGDESVRITEYVGDKWTVRIPPRIQGLPVTHIGFGAFENKQLTSVTIPNSVTTIESLAFSWNRLTSVTIPDSVTSLSGFDDNQLTSVTIPNSVTTIRGWTFQDNQLTSVIIPDSVTTIGGCAFIRNQLTSVIIPNSVTSIGRFSFAENQLTSVVIGNSVATIGEGAFADNQLTSITIGANVDLQSTEITGNFDEFYRNQGSRAGTYTYSNGVWSEQQVKT
jgi:hypothetical protein